MTGFLNGNASRKKHEEGKEMEKKNTNCLGTILFLCLLIGIIYVVSRVEALVYVQILTASLTIHMGIQRIRQSERLPKLPRLPELNLKSVKLTITLNPAERKIVASIELKKRGYGRRSRRLFFLESPVKNHFCSLMF